MPVKKKRGMPSFAPTVAQREDVENMAAMGLKQEQICLLIRNPRTGKAIDAKTLRRAFREEFDVGRLKANYTVAKSLYKRAVDGEGRDAVIAAIFWLKVNMGWKETSAHELTGKEGGPIPIIINKNEVNF